MRFPGSGRALGALLLAGSLAAAPGALASPAAGDTGRAEDSAWIPLFNGRDLEGWTAKFEGEPLGENPDSTFAVEDGMLFANNHLPFADCPFGHLFYVKRKFSHYLIRAEYRFPQEKSAPGYATWTNQNNGLMLHSQDPKTLGLGASFPSSMEVQLLGPKNTNESGVVPSADWPVGKTANLCTPQSFVSWNGKDHTQHCTPAQYPAAWKGTRIPWDREFSEVTVRVLGDSLVSHHIRGEKVFEYTRLRLDDGTPLREGYVSIQAEGTPTLFRRLEVLDLVGCMDKAKPAYRSFFVKHDPAACGPSALASPGGEAAGARAIFRGGLLSVAGTRSPVREILLLAPDGRVLATLQGPEASALPRTVPRFFLAQVRTASGAFQTKLVRPDPRN